MIHGRSVLAAALVALSVGCGDSTGASPPEEGSVSISGGIFHLGEAGGVEPTINIALEADGTFRWRTDPGRYGDWIPSGNGTWTQSKGVITLRPSAPDRSMAFSATLGGALYPSTNVASATLRVVADWTLVTASVTREDGRTWSPPNGVDAREITWARGRACTSLGRSNGCPDGP